MNARWFPASAPMASAETPLAVLSAGATVALLLTLKNGTAQVSEGAHLGGTTVRLFIFMPQEWRLSWYSLAAFVQTLMSAAYLPTSVAVASVWTPQGTLNASVTKAMKVDSWWWRTAWVSVCPFDQRRKERIPSGFEDSWPMARLLPVSPVLCSPDQWVWNQSVAVGDWHVGELREFVLRGGGWPPTPVMGPRQVSVKPRIDTPGKREQFKHKLYSRSHYNVSAQYS